MITRHDNRDRCPRRRYALSLRRGVTLIELMFSIGILLVGLLGVAALIPLAGWEIGRGLTADRMAAAGRNAVQEFDIRNMRRTEMWAYYDQSPIIPPNQSAYCIDPLGRTIYGNQPNTRFPWAVSGVGATMPRISLFDQPGRIMDRELAERIFIARDDLAVDRPVDPTLPPEQVYGAAASQRQYNGSFSWFATLVRQVQGSEEFVLSIVVLEDRNLQAGGVPSSLESWRTVRRLSGFGSGGGEVVLTNQLDLDTGDWLMLTAGVPGAPDIFRWYRVVNSALDEELDLNGDGNVDPVEDFDGNGSFNPVEFVTLEGADIDFSPNRAVLVPGVVGVFEKTIRIEGSSMWDTTP